MKVADLRRLTRGSALLLVAKVVGSMLALALDATINGHLDQGDYGAYATARRVMQVGLLLGLVGTSDAVVRFVGQDPGHLKDALRQAGRWTAPITGILAVAAFWGAPQLADWLNGGAVLSACLRLAAVALPFLVFRNLLVSGSQGLLVVGHKALVQELMWPGVALLVYLLALHRFQAAGAMGATLLSAGVGCLVAAFLLARIAPTASTTLTANLSATALPLWAASAIHAGYAWVDQLIIAGVGGMEQAGAYAPVALLGPLLGAGLVALSALFAPMIARAHHQQEPLSVHQLTKTVARLGIVLTMPGVIVAVVAPELWLGLWPRYSPDALLALQISAAMNMLGVAAGAVGYLLIMSGHPSRLLWAGVPAVVVNGMACALLVGPMGPAGAALANGLGLLTATTISLWFAWSLLGVHPFSRPWAGLLAAGLAPTAAMTLLAPWCAGLPPVPALILALVLAAAAYVPLAWVLLPHSDTRAIVV